MLVTSEMMQQGVIPLIFTGGACSIQSENGVERNAGRDLLASWLNENGWSYFDPQIHPTTHGRAYDWHIDGVQEKKARQQATLRIYEIIPMTFGVITALEIMDDARCGRKSIVWFNGDKLFAPIGIGNRQQLQENHALELQIGSLPYAHLLAYIHSGTQMRNELPLLLANCPHIVFVEDFTTLKRNIFHFLQEG